MFLPQRQSDELCWLAALSDREARSDLASGFVRDEDDYTSTFVGSLRRNINSYSQSGLRVVSYLVETPVERRSGCDAAIVISNGPRTKVTLFEAKLPHIAQPGRPWDYRQTASGLSHFSDQLERQKQLPADFAVFEMFYCDYPFTKQPPYMSDEFSSCVWRDSATAFDDARAGAPHPWSGADLRSLLEANQATIDDILSSVCRCDAGTPLQMSSRVVVGEYRLEGHVLVIEATG